jgi:hypothetical protein
LKLAKKQKKINNLINLIIKIQIEGLNTWVELYY